MDERITATEAARRQREDEDGVQRLLRAFEGFTQRWQPGDRRAAADFSRDLSYLVHVVHQDAARPFTKALTAGFVFSPPGPVVVRADEKAKT